ncbi:HTH-type transcriptional repressor PurR [Glaesserella parasuis]|uniref:HTH-type transcriptional repressor PurR n=1 Tax=Glaesserella parasuis TaxID=738 RepID=UPI0024368A83|nr:HTH-type transcriptional repressor PurR [Glaesserella parasuis]MDG6285299.1 HTH-type transcriptional repressor PurR [Glaesserella parasuis]MDP0404216.1 HTH-type transcriptional repressor PurR [Glaesserella parasuis]MDP0452312.1 HTH-type transcriptional repressor PurR [Glaesserella parasuis]MDP0469843.1 HTH-type transcriptional repressor PurR [Glaesserella parasuis]MDP0478876.1 HTH-type transcriptional repressor PurR [Glaesserella parasuis]
MATIKDVAKLVGVSTTTVSHVINKTRFVAEDTTKAVWEAIASLNYSPSAVARSLKVNTTKSIGMIITTSEAPYFAEIVLAVEEYCYRQGYSLFLCNTQNDAEKVQNHLDMLIKKRVDGILVMCSEYTENSLALFNGTNVPMVVMDWGPNDGKSDRIIDHCLDGGYMATKHLIDNGHCDIAIIAGYLYKTTAKARYDGFVKAMTEAGLLIRKEWIFENDFQPEGGYESMNNLLKQDKLPTAVICGCDAMALGVISAITEKGLSVPQDISVIGYDNIHSSRFYAPPLTTIHQSKTRLGQMAIDTLLERIQQHNEQPSEPVTPKVLEFYPELVVRSSVRNLNQ